MVENGARGSVLVRRLREVARVGGRSERMGFGLARGKLKVPPFLVLVRAGAAGSSVEAGVDGVIATEPPSSSGPLPVLLEDSAIPTQSAGGGFALPEGIDLLLGTPRSLPADLLATAGQSIGLIVRTDELDPHSARFIADLPIALLLVGRRDGRADRWTVADIIAMRPFIEPSRVPAIIVGDGGLRPSDLQALRDIGALGVAVGQGQTAGPWISAAGAVRPRAVASTAESVATVPRIAPTDDRDDDDEE